MQKDIIIVENFYAEPLKVREYALNELKNNSYLPYNIPNTSQQWKATKTKKWNECPFKGSESLVKNLENVIGEKIDIENWRLDYPEHGSTEDNLHSTRFNKSAKWNCAFHLKPVINQKLGDGIHNHVTDVWNGVGADGWVGLIYLNPSAPKDTGLFLWGNVKKNKNYEWMTDSKNWILIDSLGAVFNRLILCRGKMPHSGADGFANEDENGRLYQTFFLKTIENTRLTFESTNILI
jgi:hypothetical protein